MTTAADPTADRALKARHRAMWALGRLPGRGHRGDPRAGPGPGRGERGAARRPGARRGRRQRATPRSRPRWPAPRVVASRPDAGAVRGRPGVRGAGTASTLEWAEADAEALPFDDGEFDAVLSCVGVMFAPHHQRAADELVRVCRPGGTIGLLNWTPEGFIGQMFATMKPYAPPPPPGAQPPPLWGDEEHVRALLGDRVTDVVAPARDLTVDRFADAGGVPRRTSRRDYGPTIAAYRDIADDPERVAALDRDLAALAARFDRGTGGDRSWTGSTCCSPPARGPDAHPSGEGSCATGRRWGGKVVLLGADLRRRRRSPTKRAEAHAVTVPRPGTGSLVPTSRSIRARREAATRARSVFGARVGVSVAGSGAAPGERRAGDARPADGDGPTCRRGDRSESDARAVTTAVGSRSSP